MLHMSLAWITEQHWIKPIKIILQYAVLVKKTLRLCNSLWAIKYRKIKQQKEPQSKINCNWIYIYYDGNLWGFYKKRNSNDCERSVFLNREQISKEYTCQCKALLLKVNVDYLEDLIFCETIQKLLTDLTSATLPQHRC